VKKLGATAYPFNFHFPRHSPTSVILQPAPGDAVSSFRFGKLTKPEKPVTAVIKVIKLQFYSDYLLDQGKILKRQLNILIQKNLTLSKFGFRHVSHSTHSSYHTVTYMKITFLVNFLAVISYIDLT
jgi:hypothetical protein